MGREDCKMRVQDESLFVLARCVKPFLKQITDNLLSINRNEWQHLVLVKNVVWRRCSVHSALSWNQPHLKIHSKYAFFLILLTLLWSHSMFFSSASEVIYFHLFPLDDPASGMLTQRLNCPPQYLRLAEEGSSFICSLAGNEQEAKCRSLLFYLLPFVGSENKGSLFL